MNGMKYVVLALEGSPATERMYLFSSEETHKDFAQSICMPGWKPVRAGFIFWQDWDENGLGRFLCRGESFSLGLSSDRVKDRALLLKQLEP